MAVLDGGEGWSQIWKGQRAQRYTAAAAEAHCLIASAGKVSDGGAGMKLKLGEGGSCLKCSTRKQTLGDRWERRYVARPTEALGA